MSPEEFMAAIENICRVTLLNVEPGAVVVLEVDHPITVETASRIREVSERVFHPHKVAVLADGVRLAGARVEVTGGDAGAHRANREQVGQ